MARLPRRKVSLTYIANHLVRKATFRRRKKGLTKKVDELIALCGVDACAIIYSPDDNQPEVFPSADGTQGVLSRFQNLSEFEKSKNKMDHIDFLKQRIEKTRNQLQAKQHKTNRDHEIASLMSKSLKARGIPPNVNREDLAALRSLVEQNLRQVDEVLLKYHNKDADHPTSP